MLKEVKIGDKLVGHYDTERGPLGHVEWYYIDAKGKRQFGGGDHTVSSARSSVKRRYEQEHSKAK